MSIRGETAELKGAAGSDEEQARLRALLVRYRHFARDLIAIPTSRPIRAR